MAGDRRVRAGEQAERVNAAGDLLEAGVPAAEAARVLAGRFGVSVRQARRYADQARASVIMPAFGPNTFAVMRSTRRCISAAARREKVINRMRRGSARLTMR